MLELGKRNQEKHKEKDGIKENILVFGGPIFSISPIAQTQFSELLAE